MEHPRSDSRCRRGFAAMVRAAAAAMLTTTLGAGVGAAQQTSRPAPVPCAVPAERIDWVRRTLFASLRTPGRGAPQLPRMYRLLLLEDLTARLRAPLFANAGAAAAGARDTLRLPSGDGRYSARAALNRVRVVVRGDGSVGRIVVAEGEGDSLAWRGDSLFADDVRRALEQMAAEHTLLPIPDREPTDSAELQLWVFDAPPSRVITLRDSTSAVWPLFELALPRMREAAPAGGRTPMYPSSVLRRRIQGTLLMEFVVDEHGQVDTSSIRDIRRPTDVPKKYETAYQAFVKSVRAALPEMTYRPAEVMGCRVKQKVRQPFAFGIER